LQELLRAVDMLSRPQLKRPSKRNRPTRIECGCTSSRPPRRG